MGGFFQALGAGLAGAGEQAGPFRDRENANRLREWETNKAHMLKAAEELAANSNDPVIRNRISNWYAKAGNTVYGDKNQMKLLEEFQQLSDVHPEISHLFKTPETPKGPGPAAPGTMPGSLQEMQQAQPRATAPPNPTGDFSSMLAGPPGSWMGQAGASAGAPSAAQPAASPVQGSGSPMPDLGGANVIASAPTGSGSPTYDRMSKMPWITPAQRQMAIPIIQAELQAAQRAVDAETGMAQKQWEIQNTPYSMTPGMELVGGGGNLIHKTNPLPKPYMELDRGAVFDPNTNKLIRDPDMAAAVGTPFNAAFQEFTRTHGRVPNQAEINQINSGLRGGDPLYPVAAPGGGFVYAPRGQAVGQAAPRTTYDITGTPSIAGQPGMSTTAPPALDAATQTQLTGLKTTIDQATKVSQLLNNPEFTTLGPVLGRIKLAEIEKLGGLGATPKQIQLATALKRLLSTNAFAQGGKNLTTTELNLIQPTFPQMSDTLEAAITKTKEAIKFYNQFYQDRVRMMSPRQQGQVPALEAIPNSTRAFVVGNSTYNIPADQVQEFLKSHPNAVGMRGQ